MVATTSPDLILVSRASRIFRATGFRFSWRNLWQSNEIAGWLISHVTTEKARD